MTCRPASSLTSISGAAAAHSYVARRSDPNKSGLSPEGRGDGDPSLRLVLSLLVSMRVGSLGMLVRELAMFLGGRCMMLRLLVLAAHVVMIGLMVVMRSGVMVTGRSVVMLGRRMFCHLSMLPLVSNWDGPKLNRPTFPVSRGIAEQTCALRTSWQWNPSQRRLRKQEPVLGFAGIGFMGWRATGQRPIFGA